MRGRVCGGMYKEEGGRECRGERKVGEREKWNVVEEKKSRV